MTVGGTSLPRTLWPVSVNTSCFCLLPHPHTSHVSMPISASVCLMVFELRPNAKIHNDESPAPKKRRLTRQDGASRAPSNQASNNTRPFGSTQSALSLTSLLGSAGDATVATSADPSDFDRRLVPGSRDGHVPGRKNIITYISTLSVPRSFSIVSLLSSS